MKGSPGFTFLAVSYVKSLKNWNLTLLKFLSETAMYGRVIAPTEMLCENGSD